MSLAELRDPERVDREADWEGERTDGGARGDAAGKGGRDEGDRAKRGEALMPALSAHAALSLRPAGESVGGAEEGTSNVCNSGRTAQSLGSCWCASATTVRVAWDPGSVAGRSAERQKEDWGENIRICRLTCVIPVTLPRNIGF